MNPTGGIPARLDHFGRRHPRVMLLALIALAACATVLLLFKSEGAIVLYQRF
ncbi:MAG TPA: hypothetical protein VMQ62_14600 [Dongiaceae bacterium]|nr:hypothetical protein [Dongiaceae bacterium]